MHKAVFGVAFLIAGCSQQPSGEEAVVAEPVTASSTPAADDGTPYSAPADPNATYSLLTVKPGKAGKIVALTRRSGPSGTSFANREIDCGKQLARYIGEGDSIEEATAPSQNPGMMSPLIEGSSTWAAVQAACSKR